MQKQSCKRLIAIVIPLLIFSVCLTGCGTKKKKKTIKPFLKSEERKRKDTTTNKTLKAGNYFVGYDLPEGVYTLSKNENSGNITIVRKKCPVENFHIDDTHQYSRTFEKGDIIIVHGTANIKALSSNSSTVAVKPRPNLPGYGEKDERRNVSINGECIVGDDLEDSNNSPAEGWYNILVTSSDTKLHVKVEGNLGENIDEDLSFDDTLGPTLYRNVYLRNGQKISVVNRNGNHDDDDSAYATFSPLEATENETAQDSYGITTEKDQQEKNTMYD